MAVIYLPEWDFSCEQFAITDNNTQWLVHMRNSSWNRWYFKRDSVPCIVFFTIKVAGQWNGPAYIMARGINSTKTDAELRSAVEQTYSSDSPDGTRRGCTEWSLRTLSAYPNTVFGVSTCSAGLNNLIESQVREPFLTYDYNGASRLTDEILLGMLERVGFHEGRPPEPIDPYTPGGTTEPGGGNGNHDTTSDQIPVSQMPTISATDTNFITLYNPSITQLRMLATWMWDSSLFDVNSFQKLFQSPMQAILGLSIVPVQPVRADTPTNIKIGNITSTVSAYPVTTQYKNVPLGSVAVEEFWGSYLDYAPYTKVEIYLPYIGTRELNADDVMGKTVTVVYHVDVLSGSCVAQIAVNDSVMYQFSGNCATSVPITGNDWTNVINGAISVAVSGAMLATGMATGTAPVMATSAVGAVGSLAQNVTTMKPTVLKSGSISGSSGVLAVQTPYLIITRPRQAVPEEQNKYAGYPSWITSTLGELTGMTYVGECHLENIPCTDDELKEIERLLKEGVIL